MDFPHAGRSAFRRDVTARYRVQPFGGRLCLCRRASCHLVRDGLCGRPSCRGDRPQGRRTLWHAGADAVGDDHRGRDDREHHVRREDRPDSGSRYGLRRCDDRLQWPDRLGHSGRRRAVPGAGVSGDRRQGLSLRSDRDFDHHAGSAELHVHDAGAGLRLKPARVHRHRHVALILRVRLYADRSAPRLFHCRQ